MAAGLSLLGAASVIGLKLSTLNDSWLQSRHLAQVVAARVPEAGRQSIGPLQIQLWLGLREIARLRRGFLSIPLELADPILDLWILTEESDVAQSLPPHIRTLNESMITWLKQCKAAGWRLVPPGKSPAPDAGKSGA